MIANASKLVYSLLLTLALPFVFIKLYLRSRKNPDYKKRWKERLGFAPFSFTKHTKHKIIWLHTVSVGELIAAKPLIEMLLSNEAHQLVITSTTPTGSEQVTNAFKGRIHHCYIPYDIPFCIRKFLARCKPDIAVFMETELWPNTLHACNKRNIPSVLINGRMSEKSFKGYKKFSALSAQMMRNSSLILAQTEEHQQRFIALGSSPEKCKIAGNLKFDLQIDSSAIVNAEKLRAQLGKETCIWIGASTHQSEDKILLDAHKILLQKYPNAVLILVPRHPERFDDVAKLIKQNGFSMSRKTEKNIDAGKKLEVFLGDTMGELLEMYGAANVAFVGGSLVENGGHNTLEPAAWGMPVISGPSVFNFPVITQQLQTAGALCIVSTAKELADKLVEYEDRSLRRLTGEAAKKVVEKNLGATEKTAHLIERLLNSET